ncbi:MAG: ABC-2 transporter permease [Clostridiales bacterium]|nr:ABC-2 transporter permease [Clostridiales bacterium]
MKGLLLKDFYMIWKQAKIMLLLVIIYILIGVFNDSLFWTMFSVIFMSMLPITALALDERSGWNRYAGMLPYSSKDIVMSKYLFGLIGVGIVIVVYVILTVLTGIALHREIQPAAILEMIIPLFSVSCIFMGTNLPIMFKTGVEKGRMWYTLSLIVIMGSSSAVISILNEESVKKEIIGFLQIGRLTDAMLQNAVLLVVCGVLLLGSMNLAVKIYEKKDL